MQALHFPLPEVAEALGPFIKSRQDVEAIRDGLQSTFPLTTVDLPQPLHAVGKLHDSATLSGVRKAYWKALQAHQIAQARYDALKAELAQASGAAPANEQGNSSLLADHYIPLLQQREKQRRLEIIQRAYTKINATGGATIGESFDSTAMLGIGELPTPPTTALADRDLGSDVDEQLLKLKKAVLSAKQQIDEHQLTVSQAGDTTAIASNPHAELRALQSAHSELTLWMEDQLAMISDISNPADTNGAADQPPEVNASEIVTSDKIESLYNQYLEARNRLLDTIEIPPPINLQAVSMALAGQNTTAEGSDAEPRTTPSEAVLPYLAPFISAKLQEQALLHQNSYVRRQLARSEEESRQVMARLADESHLVQPGASHGRDWAEAAAAAGQSTVELTMARAKDGKLCTDSAMQAVETIQSMPRSIDALT